MSPLDLLIKHVDKPGKLDRDHIRLQLAKLQNLAPSSSDYWCEDLDDLRTAFVSISEDMKTNNKPINVTVKTEKWSASKAQKGLMFALVRQVRKHFFKSGIGYVEYVDQATGMIVRLPMDDEMVLNVLKRVAGAEVTALGHKSLLSVKSYTVDMMTLFIQGIDTYAATELGLKLKFKKKDEELHLEETKTDIQP